VIGGFSLRHATELVASGWRPEGQTAALTTSTLRPLPRLCDPGATEQELLGAVLAHYQDERRHSEPALAYLAELGVADALADRLGIGFANRTLGYRLPHANRKDGAALRTALTSLGIYRPSGHEHFRGCVVVPVQTPDAAVVQLCAMRIAGGVPEQWAARSLPGGIFNEPTSWPADVVLTANVADALAMIGAGGDNVIGPGRPGGPGVPCPGRGRGPDLDRDRPPDSPPTRAARTPG
jgi:hypothetical protein